MSSRRAGTGNPIVLLNPSLQHVDFAKKDLIEMLTRDWRSLSIRFLRRFITNESLGIPWGSDVAGLKLQGTDARAPPGVEPAAD